MKLGCSTLLFGGHPLERALGSIAAIGYRAIELCAIPGMADHVPHDASEDAYADLRTLINTSGLEIESIGASTNLLDPAARERFEDLMGVAAILGAPAVTTGSGGVADDEDSFRQVLAVLRELGDRGRSLGVTVSIKPHVRAAVYNTPTAVRAMQELAHPWIGLNVDASHLWRAGENPEDTILQLLPWLATARIRDTLSRDVPIGPVETQVPGGGAMNIEAIVDVFRDKKDLRFLTLEIVGMKDFPLEKAEQIAEESYHRLRPLLE